MGITYLSAQLNKMNYFCSLRNRVANLEKSFRGARNNILWISGGVTTLLNIIARLF